MAIGPKKRWQVLERDAFICQYCGGRAPYVALQVDHIIPISRGGTDEFDNLITACETCNLGKSGAQLGSPGREMEANVDYVLRRWDITPIGAIQLVREARDDAVSMFTCRLGQWWWMGIYKQAGVLPPPNFEFIKWLSLYDEDAILRAFYKVTDALTGGRRAVDLGAVVVMVEQELEASAR